MEQCLKGKTTAPDTRQLKRVLDYLNINYLLLTAGNPALVMDVNNSFLNLIGTTRERIIGRDTRVFLSEEDNRFIQAKKEKLYQGEECAQFEFFVVGKGGVKIPSIFNMSLNLDENGQPESVTEIIIDIRDQKKVQEDLEKERKKLEWILLGVNDCVSVYDAQGDLLFSNQDNQDLSGGKKSPILPLEPYVNKRLTLNVKGRKCAYAGFMRAISDANDNVFAYVETLTDISNTVKLREKEQELFHVRRQLQRETINQEMIGSSRVMQNVIETVLRCAEVDSSVVVTGETGVGKELAARAIHEQSRRKEKPFVAINCGALPESLLESELFGHRKGAFTGALSDRLGLFREADGGTLFLDEVGDLSKPMQVKLLRVLQEKEVRPVGGSQSHPIDVRIISATNKNLEEMIQTEDFRTDLYYRIAVIPFQIPPLRDRVDDIIRLAKHFLSKHQPDKLKTTPTLDAKSRRLLESYSWPGNIRELENTIEYALAMVKDEVITTSCLPDRLISSDQPALVKENGALLRYNRFFKSLDEMDERQAIVEALKMFQGHQEKAARHLGMSRPTFWRKRKKYGITDAVI